ncbi:MAG TPA: tetratricopeptide repeat protein [Pyrinomonadaceae bacterium]|nr:tetratricopeptide repeat protein [Pyrinomonadaceae bacterium]
MSNKNSYFQFRWQALLVAFVLIAATGELAAVAGQRPNFGQTVSRPKRSPNPKPDLNHPASERPDNRSRQPSGSETKPARSAANPELEQAIQRGNEARDTNDYRQAFVSYRQAEALGPQDARVYYALGNLYSDLFCNDAAIESYLKALRLRKDYLEARVGLGYAYAEEERFDHAQVQFREALALSPTDVDANIGVGLILAHSENYQEALAQITPLLTNHSTNDRALAYVGLGDVYNEQEDYQKAILQFEKAIELQSDLAKAYSGLGLAQMLGASDLSNRLDEAGMREKMYSLARKATDNLKRAIELNYNQPDIYAGLGMAYTFQFRYQDATNEIKAYFEKVGELEARLSSLGLKCNEGFKYLKAGGYVVLAFVNVSQNIFDPNEAKKTARLDEAIKLSEQALALTDDRTWVYQIAALCYLQRGNGEKAIELYKRSLMLETKEASRGETYNIIGMAYAGMSREKEAIENLEEAAKRNSKESTTYQVLASMYLKQGKYDESIANYQKAIKCEPENTAIYDSLAFVYWHHKHDDDAAIVVLKKAVEVRPNYLEGYVNLGRRYTHKSDYGEAIRWLKKGLEISPDVAALQYQLGFTYDFNNESELAAKHLKRAIELKADYAEAYLQLARVYEFYPGGAKLDEAIANLQKAAKYAAEDPAPLTEMAYIYYDRKDNDDEAIKLLQQAVKLGPNYLQAFWHLGRVYHHKKNDSEAVIQFQRAIEIDPRSPFAYLNLAEIYTLQKKYAEAIAQLEKVLEFEPKRAQAHIDLAANLKAQGNFAEAIKHLQTATELEPRNYYPHKELAKIYDEQHKREEAIHSYNEAIARLKPDETTTRNLYLGRIARISGKYAEAIGHFEKLGAPLNPDQKLFEIGVTYVLSREKAAALQQYQELIRLKSPLADELAKKIKEIQ